MNTRLRLAHTSIATMAAYQPGRPISEVAKERGLQHVIKLASNENPLGPSLHALAAAESALKEVHLYPDSNSYDLKLALATHWNITPDRLTLGEGSDNLLSLMVQGFVGPQQTIVMSQYGFVIYDVLAHSFGAHLVTVPATAWAHNLTTMAKHIDSETRLIFLANPNNPTGTWFTHQALTEFLERIPANVLVVLDEAYYEYMHQPDYPQSIALQKTFPNLVITRTFSKAYGLAGLRLGYAIASPEITDVLHRIRLPFSANSIAQAAGIAALADRQHLEKVTTLARQGLEQLRQFADQHNMSYPACSANFLALHIGQHAKQLYEFLLDQGIIVRPLQGYGMPEHLRISIGLPEEMTYLEQILDQAV